MNDWPPELCTRLVALWMQRDPVLGPGAIGRALGVSRCAVIGKVSRLKLPRRASSSRRKATPEGANVPPAPERLAAGLLPLETFHPLAMYRRAAWPV